MHYIINCVSNVCLEFVFADDWPPLVKFWRCCRVTGSINTAARRSDIVILLLTFNRVFVFNRVLCCALNTFYKFFNCLNSEISKMTIDFYYAVGSAPCRAVLFAAKLLKVDLNLKLTNLHEGEHLTPEFIKLNPQHTIPTLNDNGFSIWESKAILIYLFDKYGKGSTLYPSDAQAKAVVNQRLFFDASVLYQRFADTYYPHVFAGAPIDEEKVKKLHEAYEFLDGFLSKTEYVAGNTLTLADISIVTSVTTAQAVGFDISKYSHVNKWLAKIKGVPGYEETDGKGAEAFKQLFLSLTAKK